MRSSKKIAKLKLKINFKMKKLILISALLFSFNGLADEQGRMRCEIKSMGLETIEDGQPKSYSNYEDSEKVGDILHFTYQVYGLSLLMKIEHPQNKNAINFSNSYSISDLTRKIGSDFFFIGDFEKSLFGKDDISMEGSGGGALNMKRYYKSDWQGIFTRVESYEGIYYFTLDCRHSIDLIDEVYEEINLLHDIKFPPKKTGVDGKISNPNP